MRGRRRVKRAPFVQGTSIDPDALAYFLAAGIPLNSSEAGVWEETLAQLKDADAWDYIEVLCLFSPYSETACFTCAKRAINMDPTNSTALYSPSEGASFDGTNYLDTLYSPTNPQYGWDKQKSLVHYYGKLEPTSITGQVPYYGWGVVKGDVWASYYEQQQNGFDTLGHSMFDLGDAIGSFGPDDGSANEENHWYFVTQTAEFGDDAPRVFKGLPYETAGTPYIINGGGQPGNVPDPNFYVGAANESGGGAIYPATGTMKYFVIAKNVDQSTTEAITNLLDAFNSNIGR